MNAKLHLIDLMMSSNYTFEPEGPTPDLVKELELNKETIVDVSDVYLFLYKEFKALESQIGEGLIYMQVTDYDDVRCFSAEFYNDNHDHVGGFDVQLVLEDGKSVLVPRYEDFEFFITKLVFSIANYLSYDISLIKRWQGTESILTN